ncbi:MAG: hypothetical protein JNL96_04320 [Planctomycetaceae bacterium]|nr:hypothetical protein [Planctomycetaceae bacterium]
MFPSLLLLHTRVVLTELSAQLGRATTFDDISDETLDGYKLEGFDWIWMMGAWQTGAAGREVSKTNADWRQGYLEDLPDFTDADVAGSPFAVVRYEAHSDFGGDQSLARFRERLRTRGIKLMLDYVPNHVAIDHAWAGEHPEYLIEGDEAILAAEPQNWTRIGGRIFAHGRDPYFPGWRDTLQLNYRHAGLRAAMTAELENIARRCDGVRCDMAMLLLPNVFRRTWGDRALPSDGAPVDSPYWPEAIERARGANPTFIFLSEVYWDLESALQAQGFDYTYDKSYYDRLRAGNAESVRDHLHADINYQNHCARFLENHDEPRAIAVFERERYEAAAVLAHTVPGMRLFHQGQGDGRRKRMNLHLSRQAEESPDPTLRDFYSRLLQTLRRDEFHRGRWRLLNCRAAWAENPTWNNFIAFEWCDIDSSRLWVAVNYGSTQGQCYVEFGDNWLRDKPVLLRDQMSRTWYQRDGNELATRGLYLDMPAWGYHIFDVTAT